jgi:hypothetical protein
MGGISLIGEFLECLNLSLKPNGEIGTIKGGAISSGSKEYVRSDAPSAMDGARKEKCQEAAFFRRLEEPLIG